MSMWTVRSATSENISPCLGVSWSAKHGSPSNAVSVPFLVLFSSRKLSSGVPSLRRWQMPTIKIDIDPESFRRLTELAVEERRPIPWQAEVLLIRALAVSLEEVTQETEPRLREELVATR